MADNVIDGPAPVGTTASKHVPNGNGISGTSATSVVGASKDTSKAGRSTATDSVSHVAVANTDTALASPPDNRDPDPGEDCSPTAATKAIPADGNGSDSDGDFPDECTLFVGDIGRTIVEEQLHELFSQCGEVVSVDIKRDRATRCVLGYGFVQMRTRKQATEAKKVLHKKVLGQREIRIGWAQKNTNIFVGDLDSSVTSEQLRSIFSAFGPIHEQDSYVKQKGFGFVRFKHRAHAEVAKESMDGTFIGSKAIRIGWGDANTQKYCVHIQFDAEDAENLHEDELRALFSSYGQVQTVNLPRAYGELKGFGFIHYEDTDEGEDSASRAICDLNNTVACGVKITCNFGKKQPRKQHQHHHQHPHSPNQHHRQHPNHPHHPHHHHPNQHHANHHQNFHQGGGGGGGGGGRGYYFKKQQGRDNRSRQNAYPMQQMMMPPATAAQYQQYMYPHGQYQQSQMSPQYYQAATLSSSSSDGSDDGQVQQYLYSQMYPYYYAQHDTQRMHMQDPQQQSPPQHQQAQAQQQQPQQRQMQPVQRTGQLPPELSISLSQEDLSNTAPSPSEAYAAAYAAATAVYLPPGPLGPADYAPLPQQQQQQQMRHQVPQQQQQHQQQHQQLQ